MSDDLGDRMKVYEAAETERRFMPLLPVYARIDGRSFSRFTAGMARPFDPLMTEAMIETTAYLVEQTHARIGYTQSDEINLAWLQDNYESEMFFGGKVQKMCSVLASMAAARFAHCTLEGRAARAHPAFDCRVFQLPSRTEVANAFLWRERDATKNAVSMAARSVYSHKALDGKRSAEMQEMLWQKGINFNNYPAHFKRGTFVRRVVVERRLTEDERAAIPAPHRPEPGTKVNRTETRRLVMPPFGTVTNREAVIFDGAEWSVATNS